MTKNSNDDNIIVLLHKTLEQHSGEDISFGEILDKLKDKGLALLLAVIALPIAIPIPSPLNTIFGVPLCILTAQLVYRLEHPWLPKWLRDKTIKTETFHSFIIKSTPLFNKLAKFLKPRMPGVLTNASERVMGILCLLCAISIVLPILFGNSIPSAAIFIMSLAIMYKDGLVAIFGMVMAVIGLIISSSVVALVAIMGTAVIEKLRDFIF